MIEHIRHHFENNTLEFLGKKNTAYLVCEKNTVGIVYEKNTVGLGSENNASNFVREKKHCRHFFFWKRPL